RGSVLGAVQVRVAGLELRGVTEVGCADAGGRGGPLPPAPPSPGMRGRVRAWGCGVVWLWKGAGRRRRAWRGRAGCVVRLLGLRTTEKKASRQKASRDEARGEGARALVRM